MSKQSKELVCLMRLCKLVLSQPDRSVFMPIFAFPLCTCTGSLRAFGAIELSSRKNHICHAHYFNRDSISDTHLADMSAGRLPSASVLKLLVTTMMSRTRTTAAPLYLLKRLP